MIQYDNFIMNCFETGTYVMTAILVLLVVLLLLIRLFSIILDFFLSKNITERIMKGMKKFMKKLNGKGKINYTITDTNGNVQTAKVTVNRDNITIEGLKEGRYIITESGNEQISE